MEYTKGDLVEMLDEGHIQYIAHQVNLRGIMGAGIAKQLKEKYPPLFKEYRLHCRVADLGSYFIHITEDDRLILNLFAQEDINKARNTNYSALAISLAAAVKEVVSMSFYGEDVVIGIPKYIGCGLGGGTWSIVEALLEDVEAMFGGKVSFLIVEYNK